MKTEKEIRTSLNKMLKERDKISEGFLSEIVIKTIIPSLSVLATIEVLKWVLKESESKK